jgi:hypothetical protein
MGREMGGSGAITIMVVLGGADGFLSSRLFEIGWRRKKLEAKNTCLWTMLPEMDDRQ